MQETAMTIGEASRLGAHLVQFNKNQLGELLSMLVNGRRENVYSHSSKSFLIEKIVEELDTRADGRKITSMMGREDSDRDRFLGEVWEVVRTPSQASASRRR